MLRPISAKFVASYNSIYKLFICRDKNIPVRVNKKILIDVQNIIKSRYKGGSLK